ncbi:phosphatidylglycerol lysyltransferase domain-containing protein [Williamsia sp.]|uniref:phosphatidylglycerol lysyltransferase domain-containing protein n=1 Tax=Williamsia sp. TaxID=1872085 RepID=UPI002F94C939
MSTPETPSEATPAKPADNTAKPADKDVTPTAVAPQPTTAKSPAESAEPAEPAAPSAIAKTAEVIGKTVRRVPFTTAVLVVILVLGVVTGTLWDSIEHKSWFADIAYGYPALTDGKWWTPLSGMAFGLHPLRYLSLILLTAIFIGWSEWLLGTARVAFVAIVGQLVGILGAIAFIAIFLPTSWHWVDHLADVRDVGMTTAVVASVAAATACLRSPWRLRARAVLLAYVSISFLFEGTLSDVSHLIAVVVMLTIGEKFFSRGETGVMPRTRQEIRMISFLGLVLIAVVNIAVALFPGDGPFGPTDSNDDLSWGSLVTMLIVLLIADQLRRGRRWAWWITVVYGVLYVALVIVVLVAIMTSSYVGQGAVTVGTGLLWIVELILLFNGRYAFTVPFNSRKVMAGKGGSDPSSQVRTLLQEHGGSTMSWMITWENNRYAFTSAGDGVIGYQRPAGTLVALADPVCAPDKLAETVREFTDLAENSGRIPFWFSVSEATAAVARDMGWRTLQIAEDTIIDLPTLAFKGKPWQDIRSAMNRAKKEGITFRMTTLKDEPFAVLAQVRAISEEWVGDKDLPEMGFTLGSVEEALDPEVRVALAIDESGSIHGVLSWLPVFGPAGGDGESTMRGWTLDVMRRRDDGFRPCIEFLIASSALAFKAEGAQILSLSGAPLAHADNDSEDAEAMDRLLDTLGAAMEPFYGFRSLHAFKMKFQPRYEPVYMCFRDEGDLPRIGIALTRAYLPNATPGQMLRLATSRD